MTRQFPLRPRRPRRAPARALCVAAALSSLLAGVLLAPSAALALTNPERTDEMVSPIYKQSYGVIDIQAAAPDGESLAFGAKGAFAGALSGSGHFDNTYVARRGPSGWATESVNPPFGGEYDFSSGLETTLATALVGPNGGAESYSDTEQELLLHANDTPETAANWEVDGGLVLTNLDEGPASGTEEGASADLCHVVMGAYEGPLLEAAEHTNSQLYDVARGCDGEPPSLRLVALKNNDPATVINPKCSVVLGLGSGYASPQEPTDNFSAVAAGGGELFFTTVLPEVGECGSHGGIQLFVRLGGARTLEVSKPLSEEASCSEVPCANAASRADAFFKGASEDGSRVFFTTTSPLVPGDADTSNNLYLATIGCPAGNESCGIPEKKVTSLTEVSHDQNVAEAAEVQGVVKVAPDGSRVYFVARGVLSEAANAQGQTAVRGADNLYVYEPDPEHEGLFETAFVADLCSGPALSGVAEDVSCPRDLEEGYGGRNDTELWVEPEAQTAGPNGEFLVFSTYAQLLAGDTDNAKDVYRYDAGSGSQPPTLQRVSVGEAGFDANGNCDEAVNHPARLANEPEETRCDATIASSNPGEQDRVIEQQAMATRAVSEDGSRIVFTSGERLSPTAASGLKNIYEWHEGSVSLISSGSAEEETSREVVITPSGRDIFFQTVQGLVSQDTDGLSDVYDARLGGGFPPSPAEPEPCSGDACQGPLTNPAPLLVPGSVSQAPGENLPAPVVATTKKTTAKKATTCMRGFVRNKQDKCVHKSKAKKTKHKRRAK